MHSLQCRGWIALVVQSCGQEDKDCPDAHQGMHAHGGVTSRGLKLYRLWHTGHRTHIHFSIYPSWIGILAYRTHNCTFVTVTATLWQVQPLLPKTLKAESNPRVGSSQVKSYKTFHQRHDCLLSLVSRKDASAARAHADLDQHLHKSVMDTLGAIRTGAVWHLVLKLQACQC
jgi:hypothetical protein